MHTRTYRILNHDLADPVRTVDVEATPEEIETLARTGYLVRERLFAGEALEKLRSALDEVAAQDANISGNGEGFSESRRFGGLFLRHLMDKHPVFLDLLRFGPTLSVARAMLGPQVQIRGLTARVSYPGRVNQETHWHLLQRSGMTIFFPHGLVFLARLVWTPNRTASEGSKNEHETV